jgi:hypothetical protein
VPDERGDRREDRPEHRDAGAAAVAQRLSETSGFDFETLLRELDNSRQQDEAPSPQEIARQWAAVHRYASALAMEADDAARYAALSGLQRFAQAGLLGAAGTGFGFEASIGTARGPDGLKSLESLTEGFHRL